MPTKQHIKLGHISDAHGLRGEVRIQCYTERPENLAAYGPLVDESGRVHEILSLRVAKAGTVIAALRGVTDRAAAERLKGAGLYVPRGRLPAAEPDEWYHADLIGLQAVDAQGKILGTVIGVHDFGAGDMLEIRRAGAHRTTLVPFTAACVPHIDVAAGRLCVDPPEDLPDEDDTP